MNFAMFYHSVRSDWNHGNAHFLRGVVRALQRRGHRVVVYEPVNAWSCEQLVAEQGQGALDAFSAAFPDIRWQTCDPGRPELDRLLDGVDVAIVHEWNDPALVAAMGAWRSRHGGLRLLFHDTHHRMVSEPEQMRQYDLEGYDGVLAFGAVLADAYERAGWGRRAFTWHEAADPTTFHPRPAGVEQDVVWVGNWGDGEREQELEDYLMEPVRRSGASLTVHGVRYPEPALAALQDLGAQFGGWIPGPRVAEAYARSRLTVHVPRRWYRERLPGIPTIRVFEALACGIALLSAPWSDAEGLFRPGEDFLMADSPEAMTAHLQRLLADDDERLHVARSGLERIRSHHTCAHRVAELEDILETLSAPRPAASREYRSA